MVLVLVTPIVKSPFTFVRKYFRVLSDTNLNLPMKIGFKSIADA